MMPAPHRSDEPLDLERSRHCRSNGNADVARVHCIPLASVTIAMMPEAFSPNKYFFSWV
jgi:hypothetical protein